MPRQNIFNPCENGKMRPSQLEVRSGSSDFHSKIDSATQQDQPETGDAGNQNLLQR